MVHLRVQIAEGMLRGKSSIFRGLSSDQALVEVDDEIGHRHEEHASIIIGLCEVGLSTSPLGSSPACLGCPFSLYQHPAEAQCFTKVVENKGLGCPDAWVRPL